MGHQFAYYSLGIIYLLYMKEIRNKEEGINWLKKAAEEHNDYEAMYTLCILTCHKVFL